MSSVILSQTKVETQNLASHKQECAINRCETCLSMLRFLLVRRKILRLYKADAVTFYKKQAAPGNLRASSHCARWHSLH